MLKDKRKSVIYSLCIIVLSLTCIITSVIAVINSAKGIRNPYITDIVTLTLGGISFVNGLKYYDEVKVRKHSYLFFIIGISLVFLSIYGLLSN